jgi:dTDP-glucose 4,6-dehydratase
VKVVNLDKLTYSGNLDNLRECANDPRYAFVRGDIADQKKINATFKKYEPDYVINFAAETHVDRSIHVGALEFINTNVVGVFNILEAVKAAGNVTSFVQVSTDEVYGSLDLNSKEHFSEDTAFAPNVPYAATKAGGDMLCRAYHNTWKVPVIVTHCSNNYGPRQYPEKLIPFFVLRMLEDKKLPLYGDGKHVRDWIYVTDHCRALELCLLSGRPGAVYNIGADNEMDNRTIASLILKYFDRGEDMIEFVAERPGHDRRYAIDASLIRKELGWKPERRFEEAFAETVRWYTMNSQWIERVRRKTGVFNPHIDLWRGHTIKK